jgi:hypothetical protein
VIKRGNRGKAAKIHRLPAALQAMRLVSWQNTPKFLMTDANKDESKALAKVRAFRSSLICVSRFSSRLS